MPSTEESTPQSPEAEEKEDTAPREMEGWMEKQGHFVKNWKQRYFYLKERQMMYFSKKVGSLRLDASITALPQLLNSLFPCFVVPLPLCGSQPPNLSAKPNGSFWLTDGSAVLQGGHTRQFAFTVSAFQVPVPRGHSVSNWIRGVQVITPKKTFFLRAGSPDDMTRWIQAIRHNLKHCTLQK